jgi:hypothetical protein
MANHARLAPSSMGRLMSCSGSLLMQETVPDEGDQQDALEGQSAHWAAAVILRGGVVGVGEICPETNLPIDEEMLEAAEMYARVVGARFYAQESHVEEPVSCGRIHPLMWGTPDHWGYGAKVLNVDDFKYGHGFVEVFENWQLISYAAGVLDKLGIDGHEDQSIKVVFTIVQPRSYHRDGPVRTWSCRASDLRPLFNLLSARCALALTHEATCTPEPSACRDCTARHQCQALQRAAMVTVDKSSEPVPFALVPVALGHELRSLHRAEALLKARISGLEEQAANHIATGTAVPFYHVAPGRGKTVWTMPDGDVIALGKMMQVDLSKKPAAITPIQAKTTGIDLKLLDSISEKQGGALKLTPDDALSVKKAFYSQY